MKELIEQIKYKNYTIEVYYDECSERKNSDDIMYAYDLFDENDVDVEVSSYGYLLNDKSEIQTTIIKDAKETIDLLVNAGNEIL